jgi:hypothetical protein
VLSNIACRSTVLAPAKVNSASFDACILVVQRNSLGREVNLLMLRAERGTEPAMSIAETGGWVKCRDRVRISVWVIDRAVVSTWERD